MLHVNNYNKKKYYMEIPMEHRIEQVKDGANYKGYVKINGVRLHFEMEFTVPIQDLEKMDLTKKAKGQNRLFHLKLKKGKKIIPLAESEYSFFIHLFFLFADELHNDPRSHSINSAVKLAKDLSMAEEKFDVSVSISMTSTGKWSPKSEERKMLSAPKFGCKFSA